MCNIQLEPHPSTPIHRADQTWQEKSDGHEKTLNRLLKLKRKKNKKRREKKREKPLFDFIVIEVT